MVRGDVLQIVLLSLLFDGAVATWARKANPILQMGESNVTG